LKSTEGTPLLDYANGILTLDADRVQGFAGRIGGASLATQLLTLSAGTRASWAAVVLAPLDDQPIVSSQHLVLVAVGRAENTGQVFTQQRDELDERRWSTFEPTCDNARRWCHPVFDLTPGQDVGLPDRSITA
jgi:hypothetical protein